MSKDAGLAIQLEALLDSYSEEVQMAANKAAIEVGKEAAQKLRNTSPKKSGDYASGWTTKRQKGASSGKVASLVVTVYNKKTPGLTHLLEHGHIIRNGAGTYGRTRAIPHIKPVEQWANDEFQRRVEEALQ